MFEKNSKNIELREKSVENRIGNSAEQFKIFRSSTMNNELTTKLDSPIINGQLSKTGKGAAYTMGQRYVKLSSPIRVSKTSEIIET